MSSVKDAFERTRLLAEAFESVGRSSTHDLEFPAFQPKTMLRHAADLRALLDVVAKLPVNKDGDVVAPGMEQFAFWNGRVERGTVMMFVDSIGRCYMDPTVCHSTAKAAEEAKA